MSAPGLPSAPGGAGTTLEADAFKKLYPEQYFRRFLDNGIRPDGRTLRQCRAASVATGVVTTADASALAKLGSSSALAGIKIEVVQPPEDARGEGTFEVRVESAAFSSPSSRPGRPSDATAALSSRLSSALASASAIDPSQLCIREGRAAWAVTLDVYVLDDDGSLLDVALLASAAALRCLRLPAVEIEGGPDDGEGADTARDGGRGGARGKGGGVGGTPARLRLAPGGQEARPLRLGRLPLGLTVGLLDGRLLTDLTSEEEGVVGASVSVVSGSGGQVIAMYKQGGAEEATPEQLQQILAAAQQRYGDLALVLDEAAPSCTFAQEG